MPTTQAGSNLDSSITGLRVQIAALTRLLQKEGILTYSGDASVRLPGRAAFLLQAISASPARVDTGGLQVCYLGGKVNEGRPGGAPPME